MSADDIDTRIALVADRVDARLARIQELLDVIAGSVAARHADELVEGAEALLRGRRD